ncbi:ATP-grasp domain-containing protein [Salidesulfovibrio onnuriiensis]|uniref:ATP-grasp domain-containing protein n=1 Tax=Salidesulfovibrio onnuriiensis TaxID=2583823 RepID=UPI0011CAC5B7|nr:ATP-grasp domain-containing protein [Salidesulfovibrio onnuriiensis]
MIVLAPPYVSDILRASVERQGLAVLDTPEARALCGDELKYADAKTFAAGLGRRLYTNSESTLQDVFELFGHTDIPRMAHACKDKVRFRELTAAIFRDYWFTSGSLDELESMDADTLRFPLVVKPARGFFSMGVHCVDTAEDWLPVLEKLRTEIAAFNANYPADVVDAGRFIVEQAIDGDEYAMDVYWDNDGNAVLLNILKHIFASGDDVGDRLYLTSPEIIEAHLERFTRVMQDIGDACGFRNYPSHIEVRVDRDGNVLPIEANPLRFAGWCVADITAHAWGFDPYEYYFQDRRPDWPSILAPRRGKTYSMVVADLPSSVDRNAIRSVDWDGIERLFENVLEFRRIDYREFPVLAFIFAETSQENLPALHQIVREDFTKYLK